MAMQDISYRQPRVPPGTLKSTMQVQFDQELEARLDRIATDNNSSADEYVKQLVGRYLDHDVWFREQTRQGLDQLDRGDFLTHEEVGERIARIFHK